MTDMHMVIVEWDGKKPSRTYYNRLSQLGLTTKGDKEKSPLARRMNNNGSVVAQEGVFLCTSRSLARTVAHLAHFYGAESIITGDVDTVNGYKLVEEDKEVIDNLMSKLTKRGRPSLKEYKYVVTCYECCVSYIVDKVYDVNACQRCSGVSIHNRLVKEDAGIRFETPEDAGLEFWYHSRFATGHFEIPLPVEGDNGDPCPTTVSISDTKEEAVVDIVRKSDDFLRRISSLEAKDRMTLLDNVFISRLRVPTSYRYKRRVRAITEAIALGIDGLSLTENPSKVDIADASGVIGVDDTVELLYLLYGKSKGEVNNDK